MSKPVKISGYELDLSVETMDFVTLTIADQLFGVPVSVIHDVFSPQSLTPVPLSGPEIAGVLNLRGRIVTAIDTRIALGIAPRASQTNAMAIGIEKNGESYGLIIDGVGEVLTLTPEQYEPNPSTLDPRWREVSAGVYRLKGNLLVVLDVSKLINFDQFIAA